jgi:hypothetical protein
MRKLAVAAAALAMLASPADAAWTSYKFRDLGFGIDFPSPPKRGTGTYQGVVAGHVKTTEVTAVDGDTTYRVMIADFSDRLADGPNILEEAAYLLTREGRVIADSTARADSLARNTKYGRRIAVKTRAGGMKITEVYMTGGRLMEFQGSIAPGGDLGNPDIARFHDSILYNMDRDWTIPPPLPKDPDNGPRFLHPVRPGEEAGR